VAERLAIVVPGHSRRGLVSGRCLRLVEAAAELAERVDPAVVVFSGRGEADGMLRAWPGRRDLDLVVEPTARITAENAARTLPLLLERGVDRALVVCALAHAPRVRFFFTGLHGRYGVACTVAPVAGTLRPAALGRELAAAALARRQRRVALAELQATLRA
jgi:uncharacterized SAM-binding protein YcdF (DUF218 family)